MKATDIKEIEAMTGAKVVAATKETSSFNSDFVLLDDNGTIRQAFTVRDINSKMCVDVFAAEYDTIAGALAYLNMSDEELAQNIEYINPENNTPLTMNANEVIASLNENQIRRACAALLPAKFFDGYFTPERGNIALLRQILEDHAFEYDTAAAEIIEAAGDDENANETTEFNELTHAGQCLDIYLHNTAEIYERYTVPAITAVVETVRRNGWQLPKDEAIKNLTFWTSWQDGTKKALQAAARLVKKYDHMTPTAKDIEQVTRNYAAYIVDCAKYEIENAKH